ncbi:hypothetical protein [Haloarcula sp. Atlit-47R]|uniref:hypothetical protein n=1 Tax=Haloarcula sp. Atlit-47R TaxID=2282132 RepID=UPI0011C4483C|nr:hypothetical protein [Haloarcula sp. Atlit-47R]
MSNEYAEYTVRFSTEGVQSPHDRLVRLAQHSRRARRYDGDEVEADGENDAVADLLAYVMHQETKQSSGR